LFSLALLSFDYNFSKNEKKTDSSLLAIHRLLVDGLRGRNITLVQHNSQLAIYFEYLTTLPAEQQKVILGNNKIPSFIDSQHPPASSDHRDISTQLRRLIKETEEFSERVVEEEFRGLKSGVFPVDLTVKDKNKSGKILLFVEFEGEQFHYIKGVEGKRLLMRNDELKAKLYEYHYPGVPLKRIRMDGTRSHEERAKEIFLQIVDLLAVSSSVDSKLDLYSRFRSVSRLFRIPAFRTVKKYLANLFLFRSP
jgi:hypothetical protein